MEETVSNKKKGVVEEPQEKEMSFFDHLDELRKRLFRAAAAVMLFALVAFLNRSFIFDGIILAPNSPDFITNRVFCWFGKLIHVESLCMDKVIIKIVNLSMSGQFVTHMTISLAAGVIAAAPYIVWEIWRFLSPALRPGEKRKARGAVAVISFLFLLGVGFGYFIIVPLTVNFFGGYQVSEAVANQISLSSYISTVVTSTFWTGVIFLFPVFVYFLVRIGLLTPAFLKRTRRYTIVIILVLAAVVTPPDVVSQIIVSIPLYVLFEFSIWVAARAMRTQSPAG